MNATQIQAVLLPDTHHPILLVGDDVFGAHKLPYIIKLRSVHTYQELAVVYIRTHDTE
jgi:hypothetical protein